MAPRQSTHDPPEVDTSRSRRRIVVFTTSYPRHEQDYAGRFVSDAVERLRRRELDVEVVSPGVYHDFGLAYGSGVVANVKRRPWAAPMMLGSMVTTLRTAARGADLVHAHWLLGGAVAALAGVPFVVTLHGTPSAGPLEDLKLMKRAPRFVRWVFTRARAVICVSQALADAASRAGAPRVHVIPNGVSLPPHTAGEEQPPFVLFAGRLAPEKGIEELVEATRGMRLVVAGDGPLRHLVPDALGFVGHDELDKLYDRAAVVALPSRSEGFGVVILEAMAHGKPVVASRTGGIPDLVENGVTGYLVRPGDTATLRARLQRLLESEQLRSEFGSAARARVQERFEWERVIDRTVAAYEEAWADVAEQR